MSDTDKSREAIRRVKKQVEEELLGLPNVHAVDIGEKITEGEPTGELSIVVYVDQKKDVAAKNRVPEVIEGVKTDVQEEEPDFLHPVLFRIEGDDLMLDATLGPSGGMTPGPNPTPLGERVRADSTSTVPRVFCRARIPWEKEVILVRRHTQMLARGESHAEGRGR